MTGPRSSLLARLGPGILIAATGVGAGDLATGAFTGSKLGLAILWVVVLGAFVKFVLNEGLARWQLATGTTLLEGTIQNSWSFVQWLFLGYLLIWTLGVGAALMSACGVAATAIVNGLIPDAIDPVVGKQVFGVAHSIVAVMLVRLGGFRLFEKTMGVCIALMFVTVIATAIISAPPWAEVARGLFVPTIPQFHDGGLPSTRPPCPTAATCCALQAGSPRLADRMLWSARRFSTEYPGARVKSGFPKNLALACSEPR